MLKVYVHIYLQALQHGKLRRQPLQLIGGQIDMGDQ